MFFLDSTGFFSLVCLLIQCVLAWIFAAFFAAMVTGQGAWLRSLSGAFLGLGMGLTALCVRFTLAHQSVAGDATLLEGALAARVLYGTYFAGKVVFLGCLGSGIRGLCGLPATRRRWLLPALTIAGFALGCALPTAEWLLLAQAPWFAAGCVLAALWMHRSVRGPDDAWRHVVVRTLALTAAAWTFYALATMVVGPNQPAQIAPWIHLLRLNPLLDLALQVVLAASLIVVAMSEARRVTVEALEERDRLRDRVRRDEKLRAMATLVGGVAHEINNPLTAILGFAEDLADADAATRERAAGIVREQAERCRRIVQRMSLLGRSSNPAVEPVDAPALVARVVRAFEPEFARADVRLRRDLPPSTRPFVADPTGVEQVLTNLIGNALHAAPSGTEVVVALHASADALLFEITDRGPGVPTADRTRIFEPFWTTKKPGKGTGLGLAVVDAIVHAHGGRIDVGDVPGGGARFTVHWPWAPRPAVAVANGSVRPLPGVSCVGQRLLVIDDESLVRATIARQARLAGWEVVEVESGDRALGVLLAPDARFDAIACDLRMPGMSGMSFHDELARRAPHWLPRLVFVTGDPTSSEAALFAQRCSAPILAKPFATADLLRRLGEVTRTA